jgi:hypothetical protein
MAEEITDVLDRRPGCERAAIMLRRVGGYGRQQIPFPRSVEFEVIDLFNTPAQG